MTADEFDDAELVLEYETGVARRAVVVRANEDGADAEYRQEDWALGADGWRFNGSRQVTEYDLEQ